MTSGARFVRGDLSEDCRGMVDDRGSVDLSERTYNLPVFHITTPALYHLRHRIRENSAVSLRECWPTKALVFAQGVIDNVYVYP